MTDNTVKTVKTVKTQPVAGDPQNMKERPFPFKSEQVKAVLEDRKSQSRRTRGLGEINECPDEWVLLDSAEGHLAPYYRFEHKYSNTRLFIKCPYGEPRDHLWVKEALCSGAIDGVSFCFYLATKSLVIPQAKWAWKVKPILPSIFMPRWASRITLEIAGIRVERLQMISSYEAQCEGVHTGALGFQKLWDSINGKKYPWSDNPWVWVIEFRRLL
jgi:hypothetical protein